MSMMKPSAQHTRHTSAAEKEQRKTEEKKAYGSRETFEVMPADLKDETARKEWTRITKVLSNMDIIGDVDYYSLIGYCNAWSVYLEATNKMKGEPLVLETEHGCKANPIIAVQDRAAKQLRDFATKAGLSLDTRLKYAALATRVEEKQTITDEFGDI